MRPRSIVAGLGARSLLRPHIYHNGRARCFNAHQVRNMSKTPSEVILEDPFLDQIILPLSNGCLNLCWSMFEILHNCGLPWAAAIPAGAVVIRGLLVMPFFQLPARKAQQQEAALLPLDHAYANVIKHRAHTFFYTRGPRQAQTTANILLGEHRQHMQRRWGTERNKQLLPIAGLPVFVAAAETIRRMAGCRSGMWGLIFGSAAKPAASPDAPSDGWGVALPDAPSDALETVVAWKGTTALPESVPDTAILSEWFQPTFATEGALWIPNLMLPDPLMILPFVVSGITMATLHRGSKPFGEKKERRGIRILRRGLMTAALAIGPLTLHLPAGILLYWTASTSCAFLAHLYMDHFHPLRMPPKPCKKSMFYHQNKTGKT